jgi:hypothetical protein
MRVAQEIFGRAIVGERHVNPENPGGHLTIVSGKGEEYPVVQTSLALWEGPRQSQEQCNQRISEISRRLEPVESGCLELWAVVLYQG